MNYKTERALIDAALMVLSTVISAGIVFAVWSFVLWQGLPSEWSMDARALSAIVWLGCSVIACGLIATRR